MSHDQLLFMSSRFVEQGWAWLRQGFSNDVSMTTKTKIYIYTEDDKVNELVLVRQVAPQYFAKMMKTKLTDVLGTKCFCYVGQVLKSHTNQSIGD